MIHHINKYLNYLEGLKRSQSFIEGTETNLRKFHSYLRDIKLEHTQVDENHLIEYRRHLFNKKLKPKTVEIYTRAIFAFYQYLESINEIFINPCPVGYVINARRTKVLPIHSIEEINKLISLIDYDGFASIRFKTQLVILYATGMRKSELLSLKLESIDLDLASVDFIGKNNKQAKLPLTDFAVEHLIVYLEARNRHKKINSKYLWLNREGYQQNKGSFDTYLKTWKLKTGINFCPHSIRRSMATHLLSNGFSPYVLSRQILRHDSITTLASYLNVSKADLLKTHSKLNGDEK